MSKGQGPKLRAGRTGLSVVVLGLAAAVIVSAPIPASPAGAAVRPSAMSPATVHVQSTAGQAQLPSKYLGFSIEAANLCDLVQLASTDPAFVQLFKNLGPGTFRVGGGTGDKQASWSTTAPASCAYNALVMTPTLVDSFFAFAQSVGWRVIWQVPLYNPANLAADASEAAYASSQAGISSVEFGNEPNLYPNAATKYQTYINQWDTVRQDYVADGGTAPVSGPGVAAAGGTSYIRHFLSEDASKVSSVTAHFYDGNGELSTSTCSNLLAVSGLESYLTSNVARAKSYALPYLMDETNTYTHGGAIGVSNAFCSSLWAADYSMFALKLGVQSLEFHGVPDDPSGNVAGKLEYYSPVLDDGTPAPEYYGLLFYREMTSGGGTLVNVTASSAPDLDTVGVKANDGTLRVGLVNRSATAANVTIQTLQSYSQASQLTLTAPSLTSTTGVTFGGAAVASDGTWAPKPTVLPVGGTTLTVSVPAGSAMVLVY